jgi:hypothetical protein
MVRYDPAGSVRFGMFWYVGFRLGKTDRKRGENVNADRIRECVGMSKEEWEVACQPIFEVHNFGDRTRVKFCGIDFSTGIRHVEYTGKAKIDGANRITLDIDIEQFMWKLARLTDEEIELVKKKLVSYKKKSLLR